MADTAGNESYENFARLRLGQVDLLHLEGPTELLEHRRPDLHPPVIPVSRVARMRRSPS
jgi:hypothetical protein